MRRLRFRGRIVYSGEFALHDCHLRFVILKLKLNFHHHLTLFSTLGLRFLCVVNHNNQVVGIITRVDLLPESLADSIMRGRNAHMQGNGFA
jgi:hypothetical protein